MTLAKRKFLERYENGITTIDKDRGE